MNSEKSVKWWITHGVMNIKTKKLHNVSEFEVRGNCAKRDFLFFNLPPFQTSKSPRL